MTVETFWRRVPQESIKGCGPAALRALVPHFLEDQFGVEQDRGTVVGVEDTDVLMGVLLRCGAGTGPGAVAAKMFTDLPPDWDDYWMIGTLEPDAVRQIAELFTHAALDEWAERHADAIADEAVRQGYGDQRPETMTARILGDAEEVSALFTTAAAHGEAVIFRVVV